MNLYAKECNGSVVRTDDSKFVVHRWYIPNGCDYDLARPIDVFFNEEKDAQAYAKEYEMPPEMAGMLTIAQHEEIIAKCAKNYRDYKKRHYHDFGLDANVKER